MRVPFAALPVALFPSIGLAQSLVADLHPGNDYDALDEFSTDSILRDMGSFLFLGADTPSTGGEVFRTDGTAAGTRLVRDVAPGPLTSTFGPPFRVGDVGFFFPDHPHSGRELWRTDGTSGGTWMVKELIPGPEGQAASYMGSLGTRLVFSGTTGPSGTEPWISDGTSAGTELLLDIEPGSGSSNPRDYVEAGGILYFTAQTAAEGRELWRSDGTAAGTWMVKDIRPGSASSVSGIGLELFEVNGLLYFAVDDGVHGKEPWISDGTSAGTQLLVDLQPGPSGAGGSFWTRLGDHVLFSANRPTEGVELWKTDGTAAGTELVLDINPGTGHSSPNFLTNFGEDRVVFAARTDSWNAEPWITDGTAAGTFLLAEVNPGLAGSGSGSQPRYFTEYAGKVVFMAATPGGDFDVWMTDGTSVGTVPAFDATSESEFYSAMAPVVFGDQLIFTARSAPGGVYKGSELFAADGLGGAASVIVDLTDGDGGSADIRGLAPTDWGVIFWADPDDGSGREPWISDGTRAGTHLLDDIYTSPGTRGPGSNDDLDPESAVVDGKVFFKAYGVTVDTLWVTDGTEPGTHQVEKRNGGVLAAPEFFQPYHGKLFLAAIDGVKGNTLVRTDGSESGTNAMNLTSEFELTPRHLLRHPETDLLWFSAIQDPWPVSTGGVWTSNGEAEGSALVAAVGPSTDAGPFCPLGAGVVFPTNRYDTRALWASDGTPAGTQQLLDVSAVSSGHPFTDFAVVNGKVIFVLQTEDDGRELWTTDGTPAGTVLLTDLWSGRGDGVYPLSPLISVGRAAFFFGSDGATSPRALWSTDGTAAGTVLVSDFSDADPFELRRLGTTSSVIFPADDGTTGLELWVSDGTPGGTQLLADVVPGPGGSTPRQLVRSGNELFFVANDGTTGYELWSMPFADTGGYAAQAFGHGCPGTDLVSPSIGAGGVPVLGGSLQAKIANTLPGAASLLLFSPQKAIFAPFTPCAFYLGTPLFVGGTVTSNGSGKGSLTLGIPNDLSLVGVPIYLQYLAADPAATFLGLGSLSDGLEVLLGLD